MTPPDPGPQPAFEELGRRLRWRFAPLLIFVGMMIGLGVAAALSLLRPRPIITGLPDDADATAACSLMRSQPPPGTGTLRFRSELTGEAAPGGPPIAPAVATRTRELLERARARSPWEPRVSAALAHLDLARHRFEHAERGYRHVLMTAPHYGEARLGLGVALALHAEREPDPLEQRSLRLQAIAQLAAVPVRDPVRAHALFDRAVLLAEVGRRAEAERMAREYLSLDHESAWADSLGARMRTGR